jgi:hypothetical protein
MAIKKVSDAMTASLRRVQSEMDKLPAEAYNFWVKTTPKDTGNARRRTKLQNKRTINADYPYAVPLDNGWSKQAPQGMSEPTDKFIKARLKKILRK